MMTIRWGRTFQIILLFLFSSATCLQGQVKDFQSWWEFEFEKKITGKLDLAAELEQRFKNNSLEYSRSLLTLGASYDLADFIRIAGGARMVLVRDDERGLHPRYRIHLDGMGSHELSGFDLSLRTRIQYGFDEFLTLRYFTMNKLVNRNRLKVARHISGTRFGCFASAESWHGSGLDSPWVTFAMRYTAGLRFSPDFSSRFSLRYMLEDEFNVLNPRQLHVLVLGYSYRF
jgi:hypothetical protein